MDIFLIINYTSSFYFILKIFEKKILKVDFQFCLKLNYKNKMKQILISSVLMVVLCIQLTKAEEKASLTSSDSSELEEIMDTLFSMESSLEGGKTEKQKRAERQW